MRKPLRIAGRVLAGLVALILVVVLISYFVSSSRLGRQYQVAAATNIIVPTDSASVARGHVLAEVTGCTSCHGESLGGRVMIDGFPFAKLAAPNLTRGSGGVGTTYTDADWERAIRHGVRRTGSALFIMPSDEYHPMRDDELGRLIAYVKSVPPVNNTTPPRTLYPMARVVHTFGAPLVAAERMDHASRGGNGPAPGATLEYGRYMSTTCRFCHGADLAGREVGGEPGAPPSPPIGPTGNPARWTEAQFIQAMRTGVTPAGWRLRNQYMPWQAIGKLSDDELRGIHMYLKKGA